MRQTWSYLRTALLALACVGSLGFGTTQAFGAQQQARVASCPATGYDYYYASCAWRCPTRQGYCSYSGVCRCGQIP